MDCGWTRQRRYLRQSRPPSRLFIFGVHKPGRLPWLALSANRTPGLHLKGRLARRADRSPRGTDEVEAARRAVCLHIAGLQRWGDESEPPLSGVEKIDGGGALAGVVQVSPVRVRGGARPKPREVASSFAAGGRCGHGASAVADYMAVQPVDREPVSLPKSLICRETTGNSPETGFRVRPDSPVQARFGVLRGLFP